MPTWIKVALVIAIAGLCVWGLWSGGEAPPHGFPDGSQEDLTAQTGATRHAASGTPAPAVDHPPVVGKPSSQSTLVRSNGTPLPHTVDGERGGGGVEVIIQFSGEPLGCTFEVFTSADPIWPYPVDRPGADAPHALPGEGIDMNQAFSIPELTRHVGSNGRCLIPRAGLVSVSLAVVTSGFGIRSLDRVALAVSGDEPNRLVVELDMAAVPSIVGRVVDTYGKGVPAASVVWTATRPIAAWQLRPLPGALMRNGGDQLRANLEVSGTVNEDGAFEISPVLPSDSGVVRVFLGDLLVGTHKAVCTNAGQKTTLEPIMIQTGHIVTVRLSVGGQWAERFQVHVSEGTHTGASRRSEGQSGLARSNHLGEIRVPVRGDFPLTIRPMLDDQAGRFSRLYPPNLAFHKLLFAVHELARQVLSHNTIQIEVGQKIGADVAIELSQPALDAAGSDPSNSVALDRIRDAITKSPEAPKDLVDAARAAIDRRDLLPLMRKLFEARD